MKSKKNILILIALFLTSSLSLFCQNNNEKKIKVLLKEATVSFNTEDYLQALIAYKQILKLDWSHENAGVNAALSIFKLNYAADSTYFLIPNLSANKQPDAKFYLAKIRHKQREFDDAIKQLESYKKINSKQRTYSDLEIDYLYNCCANAKALISQAHLSVIKNIGTNINSVYDDYVPVITPEEDNLYFTSKRKGSSNNKKNGDNNYFEDVYVSRKKDSVWQMAENLGFPINTETNDACVAISNDGLKMIIYRTSEDGASGDLYVSKQIGNQRWEKPQLLGKEINTEFIETSACFSNDSNELYFSSNRPNGFGGKDIYRIRKLPDGRWAQPFNLGSNVNTPYDEDAPYLHPNGISLYFSSKGHNTMGDYDVFKSVLTPETHQFSKPENLGFPINDVDNDIFFVMSADGKRGYYSSVKKGSIGGSDIYQVDTRFGDDDVVVKHGRAYLDNVPSKIKIALVDKETNEIVGEYFSNSNTGKFIMVLNPIKAYKMEIDEEGFEPILSEIKPFILDGNDEEFKINLKKLNAK